MVINDPNQIMSWKPLALTSKSLLYNLSCTIHPDFDGEDLSFRVSGQLRAGPIKSTIEGTSIYKIIDSKLTLNKSTVYIPNFKIRETYSLRCNQEGDVVSIESFQNKENEPIFDAVLPIFLAHFCFDDIPQEKHVAVIVGKKLRPIFLKKQKKRLVVFVENTKRAHYDNVSSELQLSPFGIKIKLQELSESLK